MVDQFSSWLWLYCTCLRPHRLGDSDSAGFAGMWRPCGSHAGGLSILQLARTPWGRDGARVCRTQSGPRQGHVTTRRVCLFSARSFAYGRRPWTLPPPHAPFDQDAARLARRGPGPRLHVYVPGAAPKPTQERRGTKPQEPPTEQTPTITRLDRHARSLRRTTTECARREGAGCYGAFGVAENAGKAQFLRAPHTHGSEDFEGSFRVCEDDIRSSGKLHPGALA